MMRRGTVPVMSREREEYTRGMGPVMERGEGTVMGRGIKKF